MADATIPLLVANSNQTFRKYGRKFYSLSDTKRQRLLDTIN